MAGVKRSRSRAKKIFSTKRILPRMMIFLLIVTESTDSVEDYKYQPVSKALANTIEVNAMDDWSFAKGSNGTVLASGSMQVGKIINDTLMSKWNNGTGPENWWTVCQLPIIVTVTGVLAVIIIALLVVFWFKRQMPKDDNEDNVDEGSDSIGENPANNQPTTGNNPSNPAQGPQQPAPSQPLVELNDYAGAVVAQEAEPVRQQERVSELMAKSGNEEGEQQEDMNLPGGRGLLERRGSFASLTIGLPQGTFENRLSLFTPPEENTDEYLLTSMNILTRSQLAHALKNTQDLHAEFWDIPLNHPERIEVALSGTKNRYDTIMPNDRTRVKLDIDSPNPLDSYINANYIRGFEGEEKAYIATQGPLHNTVVDLYHMIWKEKSPAIVMITKLFEKGKRKCENYFPLSEGQSVTFGDYSISTASVTSKGGYTVRELIIKKDNVSRLILHYWLDTWPDHKIPDDANTILAMAADVEELRQALKINAYPQEEAQYKLEFAPIIVHCSAGIGRTGCFIGITTGMNQLQKENKVDVLGIVCQMRYDRGGMVQTAEQYEFVHKALAVFAETLPGPGPSPSQN